MNPRLIFSLFVAAVIAQLAVPLGQIRKYEDILRTGETYKFRTAPVDPYDAFRGRYVALNYADTVAELRQDENLESHAPAYVRLLRDETGFAQYGEISGEPPGKGDFLRVEYLNATGSGPAAANFRLPFDRFFMEETKAPRAEAAYRKYGNRRGPPGGDTYVLVRVKDGRGVIEDLFIDGKPVGEFLAAEATGR
ncbi:MAG: GDYXXLXY domain-containing protein [Desulfobacterales bacterium]|jgi:uncharacterized membrane-anchored protein